VVAFIVHGDFPVSRLSVDDIGDARGVPFFVHIYTIDKTANTLGYRGLVPISVLGFEGKGFTHESGVRTSAKTSASKGLSSYHNTAFGHNFRA
jgi:hypothetical protein